MNKCSPWENSAYCYTVTPRLARVRVERRVAHPWRLLLNCSRRTTRTNPSTIFNEPTRKVCSNHLLQLHLVLFVAVHQAFSAAISHRCTLANRRARQSVLTATIATCSRFSIDGASMRTRVACRRLGAGETAHPVNSRVLRQSQPRPASWTSQKR